jgi:hypothetical protein
MEILQFKQLMQLSGWWYAKAYTAIVGALTAYLAFATGDESMGRTTDPVLRQVFHLHENWATTTLIIFTIIAVHYLIELLLRTSVVQRWAAESGGVQSVWQVLKKLSTGIGYPAVLVLLALAGLCAVTITGGLGGSMVYGPNADPVVTLIYKLFVTQ